MHLVIHYLSVVKESYFITYSDHDSQLYPDFYLKSRFEDAHASLTFYILEVNKSKQESITPYTAITYLKEEDG